MTSTCILGLIYSLLQARPVPAKAAEITLTKTERDWLAAHQPIKVGVDGFFPPYSYIEDNGELTGLVLEHWQLLAGKLGLEYQISPRLEWQDIFTDLNQGKLDLVLTMVKTPEREALFTFTSPYIFKSLVIIANKTNTHIQTRNDIANRRVALVKDYSYVKRALSDFPNISPYYVDTMLEALEAVESGKADAAISMFVSAKYLQEKYQLTELRFVDYFVKHAANESFAVRKQADILAGILEKGLKNISAQERQALNQKWRTDLALPVDYTLVIRITLLSLVAIALLSLWLWQLTRHNRQLRIAQDAEAQANAKLASMARTLEVRVQARTRQLSNSAQKYRSLVESLQDEYIFFKHDKDGTFSYISPSVKHILGYAPAEFRGNFRLLLTDNPENKLIDAHLTRCLSGEKIPPFEMEIFDKYGRVHTLEVLERPIFDDQAQCAGCEGIAHDISKLKQHQQRLHWLSHYDELTGLCNRRLFMLTLSQAIADAEAAAEELTLMFVELKRFKTINDNLGHNAGDLVLIHTAQRLTEALGPEDTIARFAGDKFYMLLPMTGRQEAEQCAKDIIQRLKIPFDIGEQSFTLDCRIGISLFPDDGTDPDAMLKHVDAAIHNTKQTSQGYAFYNQQQDLLDRRRLIQEQGLRRALNRPNFDDSFELTAVYQSINVLPEGIPCGFEALIRWRHPEHGDISPAEFIPLAEETGLIFELSRWMLTRVCRQALEWHRQGFNFGTLSVNLSAVELMNINLAEDMLALFADMGVSPHWFKLEITETALMTSPEQAVATLNKLVAAGANVVIDDFGTGYSSLSYLKTLPAETIKIDQSFIKHLLDSPEDQALVKAVISMSHSLGKQVTAEGVETAQQLDFLIQHGCNKAQGYWFSKPLSPGDLLLKYALKDKG